MYQTNTVLISLQFSNIFQVDWPIGNGWFVFSDILDGTVFDVMGDSKENIPLNCYSHVAVPTSTSTSSVKSFFNRLHLTFVFRSSMKRTPKGVTLSDKNRAFITVNEETANVTYILQRVKEKFGEGVVLVSCNGPQIVDEEGTRGRNVHRISLDSKKKGSVSQGYIALLSELPLLRKIGREKTIYLVREIFFSC